MIRQIPANTTCHTIKARNLTASARALLPRHFSFPMPTFGGKFSVVLLLATTSGCAVFSEFKRADSDQDGWISAQEASTSGDLAVAFESADGDRNGYLDSTEFTIAQQLLENWRDSQDEVARGGAGAGFGHSH